MVSKKSCLEVHPDAQETPPTNNPSPSPTPPPAEAPAPPPPASAPTPQPVSPPSEGAGSVNPPDHVPTPSAAPGTASQSPPPIVDRPAGSPLRPGGPIFLDELPRTGAPLGWLAVAGFGALTFGIPVLAVGRRRFRR